MERLYVNHVRDIIHRLQQGQSQRQIARDLRMSRDTIAKYFRFACQEGYLDVATGDSPVSGGDSSGRGRGAPELPRTRDLLVKLGPVTAPPRRTSTVAAYQEVVERLLGEGVELTALLARLREDHGYTGTYSSLWRFVQQIRPTQPEIFVRVHTAPGEEAQVDFGAVGPLVDPRTGQARSAYAFVMTLCFSRHQYAELVFDQKVGTWIACHRHAFESFGGVPQRVVPDNLKAAVLEASLHDPVLGEAYRRMAQHYGFLISPTRPRTPEHKGKVESGVHYLKRNFMAGQQFADIGAANGRLETWVREVAGTRRHGTTGQAPLALFLSREKGALQPLPAQPFELCEVRLVKVHPDCHIVLDGSFYSVPCRYVGHTLEAYVGERVVELYEEGELITTHLRAPCRGTWSTRNEDYPPDKAAYLERTPARCRQIAVQIGPATTQVVEQLLAERPLDRLRSVQAILRLEESVGRERVEAACMRALYFGDPRYRRIKEILNAALDREPLPEGVVPFVRREQKERSFAFARSAQEFFGSEEAQG
jgi:transposase